MYTTEAQGSRPAAAPSRRLARNIGGVALMVIGVALMAWGAHHLTENGNCSSTGYVSYGPVPTCKGSEFLYITSAFFLGPAVAGVGWLMARISGLMWPITCIGLGVGFFTIRYDDVGAAPGAKAFSMLVGVSFAGLAALSVIVTLRKRHRKTASPGIPHAGDPGLIAPGPAAAVPAIAPVVSAPPSWGAPVTPVNPAATGSESDPFDKIAKLAQLRDTGALTDAEFQREKAKLLNEI
jgi:hypothetical protein